MCKKGMKCEKVKSSRLNEEEGEERRYPTETRRAAREGKTPGRRPKKLGSPVQIRISNSRGPTLRFESAGKAVRRLSVPRAGRPRRSRGLYKPQSG
ncbi:MAG: hypothetical protein JW749_02125 [Sedimentisphaerales bacterium]|nr:hypothetical protein [Sedimentisphaerales bacterium]